MSYQDIINKKKKEWNAPDMMDRHNCAKKIPFSSPMMNYATYGGIPRNVITEFHGANGGGKAQPLYSKVLTPEGWVCIGDLSIGDTIYSGQGELTEIDGVFPQGKRKVYELIFSDRTSIRVADNHLNSFWRWDYQDKCKKDYCITTEELLKMFNNPQKRYSKFHLDLPVIHYNYTPVPVDPYLLGALIGDGSLSNSLNFTSAEPDVVNQVDEILRRDWGCYLKQSSSDPYNYEIQNIDKWTPLEITFDNHTFSTMPQLQLYLVEQGYPKFDTITLRNCADNKATKTLSKYPELANIVIQNRVPSGRNRLITVLSELGVMCKSIDKHLPQCYLFNDYQIRLRLLQGLYDTDGYCPKHNPDHGTNGSGHQYSTSSDELSENFAFLVRSLGIVDTVVTSPGKYRNAAHELIPTHDSYTHYLKVPNSMKIFTSDKHSERYMNRQNPPYRDLVDIQYVGEEECQCIHVTADCHTYITDNITVTHNTSTAIDISSAATRIFLEEHEQELERLRNLVASGKKEYAGPLDDLVEQGPKRVLYLDLEHSFDDKWAAKMNINRGDIDVMQPPDIAAEEILQTLQEIIETGEIGLVILDSIPSLVTKAELEKKFGERTVSSLAGLLTIFFRKIVPILSRYECTMLLINQIRDNMDNPYVINTPGGQALKFYCSLRVLFRLGTPVDAFGNELPSSAENPAGYIVNAKIIKQKAAPFDRKLGSYFLMADSGIRPDFDYAKLAINKYGIIRKTGGWYTLCDPRTGEILSNDSGAPLKVNGLAKVYDYLHANSDYYQALKTYIENDINGVVEDAELVDTDLPTDEGVESDGSN